MTRSLLISTAALAAMVVSAPAQALGNSAVSAVTVHSGRAHSNWNGPDDRGFGNGFACDSRGRRDHDRDGDRHRRRGAFACTIFADNWSYYDPDFNRSWDSDSYNDWWHDRPDRAFPRWVQHNESCEPDRMWWSGSGWHC